MAAIMQTDLKPHTKEWFSALQAVAPEQAAHTRTILDASGREDVCSICGEDPANDVRIVNGALPPGTPTQIRLCDDCRQARQAMHGERYEMV
jgi:hypothetical protein